MGGTPAIREICVRRVKRQREFIGWPLFFHVPRKVHLEVKFAEYLIKEIQHVNFNEKL